MPKALKKQNKHRGSLGPLTSCCPPRQYRKRLSFAHQKRSCSASLSPLIVQSTAQLRMSSPPSKKQIIHSGTPESQRPPFPSCSKVLSVSLRRGWPPCPYCRSWFLGLGRAWRSDDGCLTSVATLLLLLNWHLYLTTTTPQLCSRYLGRYLQKRQNNK